MNKTDKKVLEYLERAEEIAEKAFFDSGEGWRERRVEIAKMIQKEEHNENS